MRHAGAGLIVAGALLAACARGASTPAASATPDPTVAATSARLRSEALRQAPRPATRAERTRYTETSSHADVLAFLDSLRTMDGRLHLTSIGRTQEGRDLPLMIASRPRVTTPAEARALGRPIVFVQGNIHAGEVEGKEALQMLLRDLALDPRPNVLDSLVLHALPNYNADGNEKLGPQARQRGAQNGPELVGQRPNAQGFDLNRDYVKAEAPETRAALAALAAWDPDAFVDLHTTNGSYHGYALTYSPSLHPAAPLGAFTHDTLLPELRRRVRARHGHETFPYGNFGSDERPGARAALTDSTKDGWYTYDHRPRFGTNYYGLRGRLSVLSEAYSHDPFERRVRSTYVFVRELLSLVAERGVTARLASARAGSGATRAAIPIRARLPERATSQPVLVEVLVATGDSSVTEPGVPRGIRRTGRYRTQQMPVVDRFVPTLAQSIPAGGWLLDATAPGADSAVALLRRHGVRLTRVAGSPTAGVEIFRVDSVIAAPRAFQGHREMRLEGAWRTERRPLATGGWLVPADQPFALLALQLLEPQADDGLVTWNVLDAALRVGVDFPILRLRAPLP
ncbi:MAG: M14 family zinc carboxypeptidase [Gemmatirosa sp.]